jgi:hypothetical protein
MAVFCNVKGCRSVWYRPKHQASADQAADRRHGPAET